MSVRPILVLPDPRLRAVADPVDKIDDGIKKLAKDMLDTMYAAPGIGLAATQIGEMKRVVVMDLAKDGEPLPWILRRGEATWQGIPPARARANSPGLLMQLALGGAGITVVNDGFALPHLERGELVSLLADWTLPPTPVWAVFPGRRLMPARTRVLLDALEAKFAGPECRAVEADIARTKARRRR